MRARGSICTGGGDANESDVDRGRSPKPRVESIQRPPEPSVEVLGRPLSHGEALGLDDEDRAPPDPSVPLHGLELEANRRGGSAQQGREARRDQAGEGVSSAWAGIQSPSFQCIYNVNEIRNGRTKIVSGPIRARNEGKHRQIRGVYRKNPTVEAADPIDQAARRTRATDRLGAARIRRGWTRGPSTRGTRRGGSRGYAARFAIHLGRSGATSTPVWRLSRSKRSSCSP